MSSHLHYTYLPLALRAKYKNVACSYCILCNNTLTFRGKVNFSLNEKEIIVGGLKNGR